MQIETKLDIEKRMRKILEHYDRDDRAIISYAYGDGGTGPLFGRLERAALNQINNGEATFSRYAIWANTVRDYVRFALELQEQGKNEDAKKVLHKVINSLSAFAEIQVLCDPMHIVKPCLPIQDDNS